MTRKEILLNYLEQAKADYEQAIKISRYSIFKNWKYKKLKTSGGLATYFLLKFNIQVMVDVHLIQFKPGVIDQKLEKKNLWFPIRTRQGFIERLNVLNQAIGYYSEQPDSSIPLVPIGDYMTANSVKFSAYEQGLVPADDDTDFIMTYYDELLKINEG